MEVSAANGRAGLNEAAAAIGFNHSGNDFQQRGFARAIPADQTYTLSRRDAQLDTRKQRRAAEGQRDVF